MNSLLEHALKYAELGWKIIPIVPRQKVPLTAHGVKDATDHPDVIRAWWEHWPDANIAVACGAASGVYAIDVDVKQAENVNGHESLKEFPPLPETIRQDTPRGGFHALYRATDPPANRTGFRPGIDIRSDGYYVVVAPSIHPNSGQYAWSPGCAPWECEPAGFPDFMRPTTKAPWVAQSRIPPAGIAEAAGGVVGTDILKRASLYLAQVDPAIQGQGGHDKLLWAASALVHGFLLTNEQAGRLLENEYNPRCIPPWDLSDSKDRKDFVRKIAEARKLTPLNPLGWLLNDDDYAPIQNLISGKDVAKLIKNSEEKAKQETDDVLWNDTKQFLDRIKDKGPISKELEFLSHPPGLLGEMCEWINATAIKQQPFLTLACVLTFCGVLFGRKVRDSLGSRTNLYCMGIAPSSAGKAHAPNQIRRLCAAAGCIDLLGGDDWASASAIEAKLSTHPATLFLCDEIGYMFAHIKSGVDQHQAKIVPLLMKLYSYASSIYKGKEYATEEQRTIVQPCCCLYGTSTPERFASAITEDELQDGWLSRCLVFSTQHDPSKKRNNCEDSVPDSIVKQVRAWFMRDITCLAGNSDITQFVQGSAASMTPAAPGQFIVPTDAAGEGIFINFDNEAISFSKENPKFACLWRKAEENARKIGVIIAAGESFDTPLIRFCTAEYACRLIRYLLLDFQNTIAPIIISNQIDEQKQKLLKIIKKHGAKGCSNRDLVQQARWSTKKQRLTLLEDLIEAEEIVAHVKEGKKVAFFWTAKHFQQYLKQQANDS